MKSIKSKLWLGNVLLVLIILFIVWLFQVFNLKYFYVHERTNQLVQEGKYIASLIKKSEDIQEIAPAIKDEIIEFTASLKCRIIIIDTNSSIRYPIVTEYTNNYIYKSYQRFIENPEMKEAISKGELMIIKKLAHPRPHISLSVPIKHQEKFLGSVLISYPLAPIEETTFILKRQLSIISLVSLILGSIIALFFAGLFTKPLLKITEAAKNISQGNFTTKIPINSQDEIGSLAKIINELPEKLQQIENFRRDFVSNISHELKTPISLITAYAELVRDVDGEDKEARNEHLQVIIDEANRLNSMVEDILYLSQVEAGYEKLNKNLFPILETINKVMNKLNYFAQEKNIRIIINTDNNNIMVYADEEKIHQAFYNILNNAINYSNKNSEITINITDDLLIEIIDHGEGIPEEDLPFIWDRFYKVDKSRKRNKNSTGLGLAIVKNILETHNFQYGIESNINKGTKVWIKMTPE